MLQPAEKKYRYLTIVLFGLLWSYLFLRAWFVSPLHDEVATYFHFIEPGNFLGKDASLDANNHLLNSFFGWVSYKLFGESFFFFRLPNVLAFAVYAWGMYALLSNLRTPYRFAVLFGILSIPYVLEYFAYARGYGLSMACFVMVLVFARQVALRLKVKHVAGLLFFLLLAVLSNLSFLGIACLCLLWIVVQLFLQYRLLSRTTLVLSLLPTGAFVAAVSPVFSLASRMREAGTLYYGSLEGLWDVTGKTLARYVFFYDADWLRWPLTAVLLVLLVVALFRLLQQGFTSYLKSDSGVIAYFLFGSLAVILLLAWIMKVNYPEDRVGMYLIPLFLLLLAFGLTASKLEKLLLVFPVFVLLLLSRLSLDTSVFTPDERLTLDFYQQVKAQMKEGTTLAGYPTMQLTWALHERKSAAKHYLHLERTFNGNADIILMKKGMLPAQYKGYTIFAGEPGADYVALKREKQAKRITRGFVSLSELQSDEEYLNLAKFPLQENWKGKRLHLQITGQLSRKGNTPIETIVIGTSAKDGASITYEPFDLRWYNGIGKSPIDFQMNHELKITNEMQDVTIYLWNKYRYPMSVKDIFVTISELADE